MNESAVPMASPVDDHSAAADKLEDLLRQRRPPVPVATLPSLVAQLVAVDRLLAVVAISDATAAHGDARKLAQANSELAKDDATSLQSRATRSTTTGTPGSSCSRRGAARHEGSGVRPAAAGFTPATFLARRDAARTLRRNRARRRACREHPATCARRSSRTCSTRPGARSGNGPSSCARRRRRARARNGSPGCSVSTPSATARPR